MNTDKIKLSHTCHGYLDRPCIREVDWDLYKMIYIDQIVPITLNCAESSWIRVIFTFDEEEYLVVASHHIGMRKDAKPKEIGKLREFYIVRMPNHQRITKHALLDRMKEYKTRQLELKFPE